MTSSAVTPVMSHVATTTAATRTTGPSPRRSIGRSIVDSSAADGRLQSCGAGRGDRGNPVEDAYDHAVHGWGPAGIELICLGDADLRTAPPLLVHGGEDVVETQ